MIENSDICESAGINPIPKRNRITLFELLFILFVGIIGFVWMHYLPFNGGPDETMRFLIPQYIYHYGSLPNGADSAVIDSRWGTSYGFTPIFSYIVSAVFMKITSFFSTDFHVLLHAARFAGLLWLTGTLYFTIKSAKLLFNGLYRWIFIVLVGGLPQLIFLSTYVNCDSFAIFSTSVIVYAWLIGKNTNWDKHSRITLAIGVSACLLSYYNAYGFVLVSILYYIATSRIFSHDKTERKTEWKKFSFVVLLVFLLCGWWFIRNGILYHGDFLGLTTSNRYGELYAVNGYKPSQRWNAYDAGVSLFSMLFLHLWITKTYCSFIGVFGYMKYWLPIYYYIIYTAIYITGFAGLVSRIRTVGEKRNLPDGKELFFHAAMLISILIPIGISITFSYFDDFQAQGRYCMPILIPLMYYLTMGLKYMIEKIFSDKKRQKIATVTIILILMTALAGVMIQVGLPMCFATAR